MRVQREEIIQYIGDEYDATPEYLWENDIETAVFRHASYKGKRKWFGILMTIPFSKLGIEKNGYCDVLNVKMSKDMVEFLKHQDGFFPAYHMNKSHWITILLDDCLSLDTIQKCIQESFELTI